MHIRIYSTPLKCYFNIIFFLKKEEHWESMLAETGVTVTEFLFVLANVSMMSQIKKLVFLHTFTTHYTL